MENHNFVGGQPKAKNRLSFGNQVLRGPSLVRKRYLNCHSTRGEQRPRLLQQMASVQKFRKNMCKSKNGNNSCAKNNQPIFIPKELAFNTNGSL